LLSSDFGRKLKVSVFGGSHEPFVGVTICGLPSGRKIGADKVQAFLKRRAPEHNPFSTSRREGDDLIIKSGIKNGMTDGAPLTAVIENKDIIPSDYSEFYNIPRPSHADYTARIKYGNSVNMSGGGPFSGRMTAPLCIAGAIALQFLESYGIAVDSRIVSIGGKEDEAAINEALHKAKESGDSLGGIAECRALNVPAGLGGPMYDGVESALSQIFFGIPGVKGVEFGAGFKSALLFGSENNDAFYFDENGEVKTKTNNHGGILGGVTSGMPVTVRVAFKPPPSISLPQSSVNLDTKEAAVIAIKGRHDLCILPRALPALESAMALGIFDLILLNEQA